MKIVSFDRVFIKVKSNQVINTNKCPRGINQTFLDLI